MGVVLPNTGEQCHVKGYVAIQCPRKWHSENADTDGKKVMRFFYYFKALVNSHECMLHVQILAKSVSPIDLTYKGHACAVATVHARV